MKTSSQFLIALFFGLCVVVTSCKKEDTSVTPTPTPIPTPTPVTKSAAKDITKFSFAALSPALDATIDATAKTIKATVPAGTDVTKLVPTITLSDKGTVSPATGVAQDFSKEVSYTVTAEDASTVVYKVEVTVTAPAKVCKLTSVVLSLGGGWKLEYDAQDRLIKQTLIKSSERDPTETTVYTYNTSGFLLQDKLTFSYKIIPTNYNYATEIINTYTYSNNRLTEISKSTLYADKKNISSITDLYEYDAQGNVSKYAGNVGVVTFANGKVTGYTADGFTIERNAQGFVTRKITTYNGDYTAYTYDSNNQLLTQIVYNKAGVKLNSLTCAYSTTPYTTISKRIGLDTSTSFKGFPTSNYSVTGVRLYTYSKLIVELPAYNIHGDITFIYDTKGKLISEYHIDTPGSASTYTYNYEDCN